MTNDERREWLDRVERLSGMFASDETDQEQTAGVADAIKVAWERYRNLDDPWTPIARAAIAEFEEALDREGVRAHW